MLVKTLVNLRHEPPYEDRKNSRKWDSLFPSEMISGNVCRDKGNTELLDRWRD